MEAPRTGVNTLLEALKVQISEKIVLVNERDAADANFILTHLMKQAFGNEENGVGLVILHNTIGHYQNVGRLLEYDLLKKVADGFAFTVEPLKSVFEEEGSNDAAKLSFLVENKEQICKNLFLEIKGKLGRLLGHVTGQVYLIIDDLSHLLDMSVETKHILNLINCCSNLSERVTVVIGTHVSGPWDEVFSNAAAYVADVIIDVTPLKTGRSSDVTGVFTVVRRPPAKGDREKETTYHYKALHREIRTFRPGDSVKFLLSYKSVVAAYEFIKLLGGYRALFCGAQISMVRTILLTIGQICFYDKSKQLLMTRVNLPDDFKAHLGASSCSAVAATALTQPFEVVRSRYVVSTEDYGNIWEAAKGQARISMIGFYRGSMLTFIKLGPQTAITFMLLEQLRLHFGYYPRCHHVEENIDFFTKIYRYVFRIPPPPPKKVCDP